MSYRALLGLILALGVVFGLLTLRQTVRQQLAIDEMTYAHAGVHLSDGTQRVVLLLQ